MTNKIVKKLSNRGGVARVANTIEAMNPSFSKPPALALGVILAALLAGCGGGTKTETVADTPLPEETTTTTTPTITITPDSDPYQNNWTGVPDTPPGGTAAYSCQGYCSEVAWYVDSLGLLPGHVYRIQIMLHDGDQNKSGGDVGEACLSPVYIPVTPLALPSATLPGGSVGGSAACMAPVALGLGGGGGGKSPPGGAERSSGAPG